MNRYDVREYGYSELRTAATSPSASQDDINALGAWFQQYGERYWNGEYFDADDGIRLYPVYQPHSFLDDEFELDHFEIG